MASHKCLRQAAALAQKELGSKLQGDQYPCSCHNGEITVTFGTYGSTKPPQVTKIPCVYCHGTGYVPATTVIMRYIGCKCKSEDFCAFRASDGVEVFGNTTYICGHCGMVTQFG